MNTIAKAVNFFGDFHKGAVNRLAHIIGFAGLFYSVYKVDWKLFAVFLVILEGGHVYNHFVGIKPYDFRLKVTFWRVSIFLAVVGAFYLFSEYLLK